MTNCKEEQDLELEALQSIFEEGKEFFKTSDTEFKLKLVPDPTGEQENHVGLTLHVTYTPDYPEAAPEWDFEDIKGLSDEKEKALRGQVEETVSSSLGMAMVYSMAECCQEYLKENNVKALSMHEEMMQRMQGQGDKADEDEDEDDDDDDGPEEEEWKGLADKQLCLPSERITPEQFVEWKAKFDEEMIASGVLKREDNRKVSGKQLFLAASVVKDEGGTETAAAGEKETMLVYDAKLFGEEDIDDLDDLSAGED